MAPYYLELCSGSFNTLGGVIANVSQSLSFPKLSKEETKLISK